LRWARAVPGEYRAKQQQFTTTRPLHDISVTRTAPARSATSSFCHHSDTISSREFYVLKLAFTRGCATITVREQRLRTRIKSGCERPPRRRGEHHKQRVLRVTPTGATLACARAGPERDEECRISSALQVSTLAALSARLWPAAQDPVGNAVLSSFTGIFVPPKRRRMSCVHISYGLLLPPRSPYR
jgi:hypothetical protein